MHTTLTGLRKMGLFVVGVVYMADATDNQEVPRFE